MKHLFEERNHIEGLLNTRFNFFIAIFASIVAAIIAVKNPNQLRFVLIVGAIIETLFAIVIGRAQLKLTIYLRQLRKKTNEAEYFGTRVANSKNKNILINGSRNSIIGKYLPLIISIGLLISIFFSNQIYSYLNPTEEKCIERIIFLETKVDTLDGELTVTTKSLDSLINASFSNKTDSVKN